MTSRTFWSNELLWKENCLHLIEHIFRLSRVLLRIHDARSITPEQIQVLTEVALVKHARHIQHLGLTMSNQHSCPVFPALAHNYHSRMQLLCHCYASRQHTTPTQEILEEIYILQGVLLQHPFYILRLIPSSQTNAQLLREAIIITRHTVDVDRLLAIVVG